MEETGVSFSQIKKPAHPVEMRISSIDKMIKRIPQSLLQGLMDSQYLNRGYIRLSQNENLSQLHLNSQLAAKSSKKLYLKNTNTQLTDSYFNTLPQHSSSLPMNIITHTPSELHRGRSSNQTPYEMSQQKLMTTDHQSSNGIIKQILQNNQNESNCFLPIQFDSCQSSDLINHTSNDGLKIGIIGEVPDLPTFSAGNRVNRNKQIIQSKVMINQNSGVKEMESPRTINSKTANLNQDIRNFICQPKRNQVFYTKTDENEMSRTLAVGTVKGQLVPKGHSMRNVDHQMQFQNRFSSKTKQTFQKVKSQESGHNNVISENSINSQSVPRLAAEYVSLAKQQPE